MSSKVERPSLFDSSLKEKGKFKFEFPAGRCDGEYLYVTATSKYAIAKIELGTAAAGLNNWTNFYYDINHINSINSPPRQRSQRNPFSVSGLI